MFAINTNWRLCFIIKNFIRILIGKLLSIKYEVAIWNVKLMDAKDIYSLGIFYDTLRLINLKRSLMLLSTDDLIICDCCFLFNYFFSNDLFFQKKFIVY